VFTGISINLVGRLRSGASFYAANGFYSDLTFDFYSENYAITEGEFTSTLSEVATFARASNATYTDSNGIIQTVTTNTPRVGHHTWDGSQWVNQGLLLESEARTNLITYSEDFTDASWSKGNTTVTANQAMAPDGTLTADQVDFASVTNANIQKSVSVTAGEEYTFSVWVWANADVTNVAYQPDGGSDIPLTITTTPTRFTHTQAASDTVFQNVIVSRDASAATIYLWGAQLEAGSTSSSYIPTEGSAATRAAETMTIPAANLPYSATAMSIAMEGTMTYADEGLDQQYKLFRWGDFLTNGIGFTLTTLSTLVGRADFRQAASSVRDDVLQLGAFFPGTNVPVNIASRHGSTFINRAVDGTALTADTTPVALPDLSTTDLQLGYDFMGTIKTFRMWGTDIGDTGIEEAST